MSFLGAFAPVTFNVIANILLLTDYMLKCSVVFKKSFLDFFWADYFSVVNHSFMPIQEITIFIFDL